MISPRSVLLSQRDHDRILSLLSNADVTDYSLLYEEIDAALVVDEHLLPGDVVAMNSNIRVVDLDTLAETTFTLVYPHEVDDTPHGVSILAPVGTALLGLRAGEEIEWPLPNGGRRRLKVIAVEKRV